MIVYVANDRMTSASSISEPLTNLPGLLELGPEVLQLRLETVDVGAVLFLAGQRFALQSLILHIGAGKFHVQVVVLLCQRALLLLQQRDGL